MKIYRCASSLLLVLLACSTIGQSRALNTAKTSRLRSFGRKLKSKPSLRNGNFSSDRDQDAPALSATKEITPGTKVRSIRSIAWLRKPIQIAAVLLPVLTLLLASRSAHAASTLLEDKLGWRNIVSSTAVLFSTVIVPLTFFGVAPLARSLVVSASRCALQVSLLGSLVLQRMMGVTRPEIVAAWILGVGTIAGREAIARIQYRYPGMKRNMYGSVLASGVVVLGLTLSLGLFGKVQPWFDPRTWIPIAGMLFGNTLNASALSASAITKQFATGSESVELRLMRGATTREALAPLVEESYRISMMPTINSLAATGIIHIPGMMSGQILAGQSPKQAALYQIVINFLIASTALLSVQLIINLSVRSIVDTRESRLRSGVLQPKDSSATKASFRSLFGRKKQAPAASDAPDGAGLRSLSCQTISPTKRKSSVDSVPVLEIKDLGVTRAGANINLALRPGDRIAISGKSGAGKTQILRSIIGLEESEGDGHVSLFGNLVSPSNFPDFRSKICMIPPNKPNLEGTPNQFYEQILQWQSQQQLETKGPPKSPAEIAKAWNLAPEVLDQEWRTLSGGESQRAALAIALALEPDVLLLDESTSLLDKTTSILVEQTLRKSNIPMIVVTHSEDQLNRFCTQKLVL